MNPKHLSVRMDRTTGDLWLTEERYRKPIKKIANLTSPIMLALCADLFAEDGSHRVERDVKFVDGTTARIIIEDITNVGTKEGKEAA